MKALPPTLRPDKRYVLGRIVPHNSSFDGKELYYAIYDAAVSLFGDSGAYELSMSVVFSNPEWVIIRCSRKSELKLRAAVATVNRVGKKDCAIRCVATSGTIAALKRKIPPSFPAKIIGDVEIESTLYSSVSVSQEKVDLYKEGIKHQDILYFTREDLEEL
ncbi:MAG: Rpp14/Pop5 family protein [Methanomicrobiaceae archaeon]|nr:Rpp14/Pop5 family protein [Methanomicrobiaceae archaeon]